MPRYYETFADAATGVKGWKGRNASTKAKQAAEAARRNDPAVIHTNKARQAHYREGDLQKVVDVAVAHRTKLERNLRAAHQALTEAKEHDYTTGKVSSRQGELKTQIEGLPELINRAETEVRAAERALADHKAMMIDAGYVVTPPATEAPAETPAAPPRGPGRPRKVAP